MMTRSGTRQRIAREEGSVNRCLPLLGALLALVIIGPAVVAQDATPATAQTTSLVRTDTRHFLPYGSDGLNPIFTVTATENGVCGSQSLADPGRPDAWDCIGDPSQTIYDPCFENPFAPAEAPGELACVASPFVTDVVLLTLTTPLDRDKVADAASPGQPPTTAGQPSAAQAGAAVEPISVEPWDLPWALELANGERCTLLSGATVVLAGERINYGCEGGGVVLGAAHHGQPVWTVSYLADQSVATNVVEVAVAWT